MIYTWIANVAPLCFAGRYESVFQTLPKFRREKADRLRLLQKKAQSVGVWALLEYVRKKYGIPGEAAFSLSHSKDYVICSVCEKPGPFLLGCDIEKIGHVDLSAAKRLFCPSEYEYISAQKDKDSREEAVCRSWVLKESFMKAVKKGISLGTQNIEIRPGTPPVILKKPDEFGQGFYFREYALPGIPYRMAVCAGNDDIAAALRTEFIDMFWWWDYEKQNGKEQEN